MSSAPASSLSAVAFTEEKPTKGGSSACVKEAVMREPSVVVAFGVDEGVEEERPSSRSMISRVDDMMEGLINGFCGGACWTSSLDHYLKNLSSRRLCSVV